MERESEGYRFALKNILRVATRRKNDVLASAAEHLLAALAHMHTADGECMQTLEEIRVKALLLVDELEVLTNFEIREVLFPLPEIKRSTREFGMRFSSNYFAWLSDEEHYSPERLMGILEDDLHKLEVARAHLQRPFLQKEIERQKRR